MSATNGNTSGVRSEPKPDGSSNPRSNSAAAHSGSTSGSSFFGVNLGGAPSFQDFGLGVDDVLGRGGRVDDVAAGDEQTSYGIKLVSDPPVNLLGVRAVRAASPLRNSAWISASKSGVPRLAFSEREREQRRHVAAAVQNGGDQLAQAGAPVVDGIILQLVETGHVAPQGRPALRYRPQPRYLEVQVSR